MSVIKSENDIALIDAGWTPESVDLIIFYIQHILKSDAIKYVILTHGDYDHIGGAARLRAEYGAKIVIHKDEVEKIRNPPPPIAPTCSDLEFDNEIDLTVGELQLKLIPTPGHSPGSTCIYDKNNETLFAGDTIISENFDFISVGRFVRLPMIKDFKSYTKSLERLLELKFDLIVPGHGKPMNNGPQQVSRLLNESKRISTRVCDLLQNEMSASQLALELGAFPGFVEIILNQLVTDGKIKKTREHAATIESYYQCV